MTNMNNNVFTTHYLKRSLLAMALLTALNACHKNTETETAPADSPVISSDTVRFPAKSTLIEKLLTAPVVSSQENVVSLPARLSWDEDHTARISSPLAGRLTDVLVKIGTKVSANQPLAHLSSPDLGIAQADVERAKSDLAQAERNRLRNKDLAEAGIIAGKDYEQSQSELMRNKAEALRAEVRLKSLGATDAVDQKLTIRSPINGVLVARNTNPGMEWRPDAAGPPLFIVSDPSYLWCWIDAPEQAINSLHKGMKVVLRSSAWPGEKFESEIDFVDDALDPASRTLKVRAKLRNIDQKLKAEMFVTAELTNAAAKDTLDIPAKAVFLKDSAKMVFVKTAEGTFTRKAITPVATTDEWVTIADGLNKGDIVVSDGALFLEQLIDDNRVLAEQNNAVAKPASVN